MNVEIELNNTLNKSQIEFDYVIQKDKIIIAYLISSQWKQKNMTMLNVWTHQNHFIVWLFNPCSCDPRLLRLNSESWKSLF